MTENPSPPSRGVSLVFFWIVIVVVLAIAVGASWFIIVDVLIPSITAVGDAYF